MSSKQSKVIYLHQRDPQAALESLLRITGLQFARWPESLKPVAVEPLEAALSAKSVEIAQVACVPS